MAIAPFAPPIASYGEDARTVVGFDADLARLTAQTLGLELSLIPVAWPDWPLGLESGRFDAVISNVGVTEARKRKFDFSTYRLGVHGFYVRKDSPIQAIQRPEDVAGLTIITGAGTNQERILREWSRINVAAGRKPVAIQYLDDEAAALLAITSGRVDAVLNPNSLLAWQAARTGATRRVGLLNAGWPERSDVAIATRKGSGLAPALSLAIDSLIRSGLYGQTLARWNLTEEALPHSEVNPPGLPDL